MEDHEYIVTVSVAVLVWAVDETDARRQVEAQYASDWPEIERVDRAED